MNISIIKDIRSAILVLLTFVILCGIVYPCCVTIFAQLFFAEQANGSLVQSDGEYIGSRLIGQNFKSNKYFWSRPSATRPFPYNAEHSQGSNLAPSNIVLAEQVKARVSEINISHKNTNAKIPIDLVTTSASGLDPHISVKAANFQIQRIAAARNIEDEKIYALIVEHQEAQFLGVFGIARVNVLLLNLALDKLQLKEKI